MVILLNQQHLNNYNDVPTLVSTKESELGGAVYLTEEKVSSCIWDMSGSSITMNEQGDLSIVSTEGHAKVTLLSNKFVFHVEYMQLLPTKQAGYAEDNKNNASSNSSSNSGEKRTFNFHKDFLAKYNLNSMRRTDSSNQAPKVIRAMHSYVIMKKVHTIFSFPKRWTLPLYLLWKHFESSLQQQAQNMPQQSVKCMPAFEADFLSFIDFCNHNNINNSNGMIAFDDQNNLNFVNGIRDKYFVSRIPQSTEAVVELPGVGIAVNSTQTIAGKQLASQVSAESLWQNDEVMPQFEMPRYSGLLAYAWKNDFSVWVSEHTEFFAQHDHQQSFIYSTHHGKYFHEVDENREGCKEKVMNVMHMWSNDVKSQLLLQLVKLLEHEALISSKNAVVGGSGAASSKKSEEQERIAKQKQEQFSDNFEIFHSCENESGRFEAYQNGCVKIRFSDRTILTWKNASPTIDIITRRGDAVNVFVASPKEFESYVAQAIEFQEYCFLDPKEKFERHRRQVEMQNMIDFELNKNSRFLTILNGKVPEQQQQQYSQEYPNGVGEPAMFSQERLVQSINLSQSQASQVSHQSNSHSGRQQNISNEEDDMQAKIQAMMMENERMLQKLKTVV